MLRYMYISCLVNMTLQYFDVLVTVHLSIFISVINQLDAQHFYFTISLFHASTCFEHMCSSSGGKNCSLSFESIFHFNTVTYTYSKYAVLTLLFYTFWLASNYTEEEKGRPSTFKICSVKTMHILAALSFFAVFMRLVLSTAISP